MKSARENFCKAVHSQEYYIFWNSLHQQFVIEAFDFFSRYKTLSHLQFWRISEFISKVTSVGRGLPHNIAFLCATSKRLWTNSMTCGITFCGKTAPVVLVRWNSIPIAVTTCFAVIRTRAGICGLVLGLGTGARKLRDPLLCAPWFGLWLCGKFDSGLLGRKTGGLRIPTAPGTAGRTGIWFPGMFGRGLTVLTGPCGGPTFEKGLSCRWRFKIAPMIREIEAALSLAVGAAAGAVVGAGVGVWPGAGVCAARMAAGEGKGKDR